MMCTVSTNILHLYFSELGFSSSLPQTKPLEASRPLISSLNREPCSCKDGVSCICFVLVFIDSYIVFIDSYIVFIDLYIVFIDSYIVFIDLYIVFIDSYIVFIDSYIVFIDSCIVFIDSCSATMLASKFMTAHKFVV